MLLLKPSLLAVLKKQEYKHSKMSESCPVPQFLFTVCVQFSADFYI